MLRWKRVFSKESATKGQGLFVGLIEFERSWIWIQQRPGYFDAIRLSDQLMRRY